MQSETLTIRTQIPSELSVDPDSREVFLKGQFVPLTRIEFDILEALSRSPRRVLSHDQLLGIITGSSWHGEGHNLEVHISRLRSKLGESGRNQRFIRTIRGIGYRFDPTPPRCVVDSSRTTFAGTDRDMAFDARWAYLSSLPDTTMMVRNSRLEVVAINPIDAEFFGWTSSDVIGQFFTCNPQPTLRNNPQLVVSILQAAADAGNLCNGERLPTLCASGEISWAYVMRRLHTDSQGRLSRVDKLIHPWSTLTLDDGAPLTL